MHADRVLAHRAAAVLAGLGLLAAVASPAAGDGRAVSSSPAAFPGPVYAIHIAHDATAGWVRHLLEGARARLAEPRCQQVLDVFAGPDGRPLREGLRALGHTPESYLGLVIFYDGRRHPRCQKRGVLAVARPGSRIVYVCPESLADRARRNPVWAEATLIHEALHTLGLGEDPPSSREITSTVIRHCGR